jgi:hypothetical protein
MSAASELCGPPPLLLRTNQMDAVQSGEGAVAGETAGPNIHYTAPPPEEPVPFAILVTWALILVTTAALLWWQSVSFQRAQRAKEIRAVEEVRGRGESGAC